MTNDRIQSLAQWGCDTGGALRRLLGESGLYIQLIEEYFSGKPVAVLRKAVESGNGELIFETAHAMKGVPANLGLTPLFTPVSRIAEVFRNGGGGDVTEQMNLLNQEEAALYRILNGE